jgi:hypothetical protein
VSETAVSDSRASQQQDSPVAPVPRTLPFWLLALALSFSISMINQVWVGGLTIYSLDNAPKRERLHQIILSNRLPDGVQSWSSLGANGVNVRVLTVWTAEGLHRSTALSLEHSYWIIETGALFLCCVLLFALLQLLAGPYFALGGLLYFGSVLPLTYLFHYFHPWDKPSLAAWLGSMICAHQRKWLYLAAVLAVGMLIKYDILVFPVFVFFAEFRRTGWRKSILIASTLLCLTVSIYLLLNWMRPNGLVPWSVTVRLLQNFSTMRQYPFQYPPLLGLGVAWVLAAFGFQAADDYARAGVLLSVIVAVILLLQSNFIEFRADMPILVLLLPASVVAVQRLTHFEVVTRRP